MEREPGGLKVTIHRPIMVVGIRNVELISTPTFLPSSSRYRTFTDSTGTEDQNITQRLLRVEGCLFGPPFQGDTKIGYQLPYLDNRSSGRVSPVESSRDPSLHMPRNSGEGAHD